MKNLVFLLLLIVPLTSYADNEQRNEIDLKFSKKAYSEAFELTRLRVANNNFKEYIFDRRQDGKTDWLISKTAIRGSGSDWLFAYRINLIDTYLFLDASSSFRIMVLLRSKEYISQPKICFVDILPQKKDEITLSIEVELTETDLAQMLHYGAVFEIGRTGTIKNFVDQAYVRGFFDKVQDLQK